ncbi:MAG: PhnD/SsuA/transferrin family substrate-binding protein, partial [Bdellovibrionales bacterium]|nr:PhnD/SsuA/transferrin family substrate-binding protein [Bdellovibrionales bacterium]
KNIHDLKGKKVAFGDFGSTSYHLAPMQLVKEGGLDPKTDIQPINISKHVGWESLKRKNVDALGLKHDMFLSLREKEEHPEMFRVIARGPDLPNDVLVAGNHVSEDVRKRVVAGFETRGEELMQAMLQGVRNAKYKDMRFTSDVADADYDYVRQLYVTLGYPEFAEKMAG